MGDIGGPGDQAPLGEDRHCQNQVVQVGDAAVIGIVGDEHVAGANVVSVEFFQHHLHRLVEHTDKGRDTGARRGNAPLGIGDAGAHVEHLVDDRAHRRLAHRREHLVGSGLKRVLDDLFGDRIVCVGHLSALTRSVRRGYCERRPPTRGCWGESPSWCRCSRRWRGR